MPTWAEFLRRLKAEFDTDVEIANSDLVRLVGMKPFRFLRRRLADGRTAASYPLPESLDGATVPETLVRSICASLQIPPKEFKVGA